MEFVPFIISGLVTGSVYGLAGSGLVLTYKTSGIFNFAHGALATLAGFIFFTLFVSHGVSWPIAAALVLLVVAPIMGLILEWLARQIAGTSLALRVAAMVGLLLTIQTSIILIYGNTTQKTFPHYLPQSGFHIGSTPVTVEDIVIVALALVASVGLAAFFKFSRLGIAMRAVVDDPDLLDLAGTSPRRVRRWAWVIGSMFAMASGLIIGPLLTPLDATTMTLLVVTAFGAAAIGAFTSLPATYVGGLALGLLQALCTKYFVNGFWTGLAPSLPFVVLFLLLFVLPKRRLTQRTPAAVRPRSSWTAPASVHIGTGVVVLAALCFVPTFAGLHLLDWTNGLTTALLLLSLGLLVRTSGQISLCHVTFLAIGACAMNQLAGVHHFPWLLALLLSGLIAVPIGAVLAIPAIRLSGLYLALATFGFGLLVQNMFYGENYMFGGYGQPLTVPRPHLSWLALDSDKGYYYLVLVLTAIVAVAVVLLVRSRLGRLLRGMADSPTALSTGGTSVNTTRLLVFCISAFLAALAGGVQAAIQPVAPTSFQPMSSLMFFVLIIITVGREPWYALLAGFGSVLIPAYFSGPNTANWLQLLFGLGAIGYALTPDDKRGVPVWAQRIGDRLRMDLRRRADIVDTAAAVGASVRVVDGELRVDGIVVRFGGLVAVDGVALRAPTGRITGLIGPNGAGKTTTFNACSGLIRPTAGRVRLNSADVTRAPVPRRARLGVGRTFQHFELFESLTVRQCVALGAEAPYAGANPLSHLLATRKQKRRIFAATESALETCDLLGIADDPVAALSTGRRRLVELARCLAGNFQLLLLDEPSSGLDATETHRFGEILRAAVEARGMGILVVEHDMSLVTTFCDYLYVLDFGELIFEGTPAEAVASPIVQAAYLGSDELDRELAEADVPAKS